MASGWKVAFVVASSCAWSWAWFGCSQFSEDVRDEAGVPVAETGTTDAELDAPEADGGALDADAARVPLFSDSFSRTEEAAFGVADVGGKWSTVGTVSVENGSGRMQLQPAAGASGIAGVLAATDVDVQATLGSDMFGDLGSDAGLGFGIYLSLLARRSANAEYSASVVIGTGGTVGVGITVKTAPTVSETLCRVAAPLTTRVTSPVRLRFEVRGANPTRLRAKAWLVGDPEPFVWNCDREDVAPGLQGKGQLGVNAYLSAGATMGVIASVDDFVVFPAP